MKYSLGGALFLYALIFLSGCKSEITKNREHRLAEGKYIISAFLNENNSIQSAIDSSGSTISIVYKISIPGSQNEWKIVPVEDSFYKIQSTSSGKYLSVMNDKNAKSNLKVICEEETESNSMFWILQKYTDDKFKIINKEHLSCLFVNWVKVDSLPVELHQCNNVKSEFWRFTNSSIE